MTIRTIELTDVPTGQTYYAFPRTQSLADWATYRIQLVELSAPDEGRYEGDIDDTNGFVWYIFQGSSQPSNWSAPEAIIDFSSDDIIARLLTLEADTKQLRNAKVK
jgi:hypothetical protein